jgi:hypothetical protein
MHYDGISKQNLKDAATASETSDSFQAPIRFLQIIDSVNGMRSGIQFNGLINALTSYYSLINVGAQKDVYSVHPLIHTLGLKTAKGIQIRVLAMCESGNDAKTFAFEEYYLHNMYRVE